jgi:hypothetical protein
VFWQANRADHAAVYLAPFRYQAVRMLVKLVMQKTSPSGVTLGPMIVVKGGACEGKSVLLARQKSTQVSKEFHALYPGNIQGH